MITTICLNPAIDKTVEVETLEIGELNRILTVRRDMGGKGLNVATVAHRLGMETQCLGIVGEDGAARLTAMMDAEGFHHGFMQVPGSIRTNMKICCQDQKGVT